MHGAAAVKLLFTCYLGSCKNLLTSGEAVMLALNSLEGSKIRISNVVLGDSATHHEALNAAIGDLIRRHPCSPPQMSIHFAHYESGVSAPSRQPPLLCQHHRRHLHWTSGRTKMKRRHPLVFSVRSGSSSSFAILLSATSGSS